MDFEPPKRYVVSTEDANDLRRRFSHHEPKTPDQSDRYTMLRTLFRDLAFALLELTPHSREQALMLTKLEEAAFWGAASIARNE